MQYTLSTFLQFQGAVSRGDRNVEEGQQGSKKATPSIGNIPSCKAFCLKLVYLDEVSGNRGSPSAAIHPNLGQPRCQHVHRRSWCNHWGGLGEDEEIVL